MRFELGKSNKHFKSKFAKKNISLLLITFTKMRVKKQPMCYQQRFTNLTFVKDYLKYIKSTNNLSKEAIKNFN